jgi:hypothetical protein
MLISHKINKIMKKIFFFCLSCFGLSSMGFSQDTNVDTHTLTVTVPEVALLDLESTTSLNFGMTFLPPTGNEAGKKINNPLNNLTVWLNYSSIVTAAAPDNIRKVTVKTDVISPGGVTFSVNAGADVGAGAGTVGTTTGNVSLNPVPDDLITGIGSCYTGTGPSKGHLLTYSAAVNLPTYSSLVAGVKPIKVTYTLSDNP